MEKKSKLTTKKLIVIIAAIFVASCAVLGVLAYVRSNPKKVASTEGYGYTNPDETKAETDDGIILDGVLDEEVYQNNNWLYLHNDNGDSTVDVNMTSYYGEKGMYFVYDVTESTPIYVNLNRTSTINSCIEMYLAMSDVTSLKSSKIFEIDLLPTGDLKFKQRDGKGAFIDVSSTNEMMAYLGTTTKGGEVNTEDCYGYCLEFFIPWDYMEWLGMDVDTMQTDYVYVNPAHITSYNYSGTNSSEDRYWYSFASQKGAAFGDVNLFFQFDKNGVIGTVPVELIGGDHYTITGAKAVIPGMKAHVVITPEEGYAINSILINGEEYIKKVSYNEDGSITLAVKGVKEGLTISASAEAVTPGNKNLTGMVILNKMTGDSLNGVEISYNGPQGEKPITLDSNGKFELKDLKQGYYKITVAKEGYQKVVRGIYLNRDIDTEITLEYEMFETISGKVWDLDDANNGILGKQSGNGVILSVDSYKKFLIEANLQYDVKAAKLSDDDRHFQQRMGFRIEFSNGRYWHVNIMNEGGQFKIQYGKQTKDKSVFDKWLTVYNMSDAEIAKWKSEKGLDLKVVRDGRYANVYLGGQFVTMEDFGAEYENLTARVGFEADAANTEAQIIKYNISTQNVNVIKDALFINRGWDFSRLSEGIVSLRNGGNGSLKFHKKYTDVDITVKARDYDDPEKKAARTDLLFEFENGAHISFGVTYTGNEKSGYQYMIQTMNKGANDGKQIINRWNGVYKLTEEEIAKYTGDGVEFRIVRFGTEMRLYLDKKLVYSCDLTQNNSGVTADMAATVTLRHDDDKGVQVDIPISVTEQLDKEALMNECEAQIGTKGYATLKAAVEAAKADKTSDTVEITVMKDVELTSQLTINRNIVLKSASGRNVVIRGSVVTTTPLIITTNNCTLEISGTKDGSITVDGEHINRIVLVQNGTGCTFTLGTNAAIINGRRDNGWGAGFYNQGTAYLYGDITGNTAGYGAAIRNDDTVTIYAGTYSNNTATVDGGAIYSSGTINIKGGNFTGNTAKGNGGAILNKGTVDITDGTFTKNTGNFGGVIRNEEVGTVNISAGTYSENHAITRGGVIYNYGTLEITGGTFTSNKANSSGGVLHAQWDGSKKHTVTIANAAFYNNSSADGGVMLCTDATISNCTFGGMNNEESLGNSASNRGGAICQWSAGTITVSDSTFDKNTGKQGNALFSSNGTITVSSSEIKFSDAYQTGNGKIIIEGQIFNDNKEVNLDKQREGIITVPATSDGDTGWITTIDNYNVISATVKDYAQGKNHEYAIVSSFYFSNGKHVSFRFYYNADTDRYQLQSANDIFGWTIYKYFNKNDSEGLYAKATEEGIPFKMVREGTKLKLYFDETLLRVLDLTKAGITADTTCIARFRVNNSAGYEVTLPFKLADKSENVVVEINDSENGSIVTDKAEYLPGETVTLIPKATLGYACSKIEINGKEVALKSDGTYSFEATEDIYEITGCFEQTENYENISFNAYMSILGDSISTYAGVSNNAQMNDTIGKNNVYYSASQLQRNQTYWGRLLEKYGLKLCVNNSTGGGRLSEDVGTDGVRPSAVKRSVELHNNDGKTPDIITVYIGINDLFGAVDLAKFENAYKEMLDNMLGTYGEAEILCCTLLPANNKGFADSLDKYNDIIRACVAQYDDRVTLVDVYEKSGITWDNFIRYMIDAVHPTAEGMKLISYVLEESIPNKEFGEAHEAKIGDVPYDTLEEAVAAAKADTTSETVEITVLRDVELMSQLAINRNIVLKNASGEDVVIRGSAVTTEALIVTSNNCKFQISGTEDGSITVDGESINRIVLVQNGNGCTFTLGTNAAIINGRRDNGWGAGFYNQGTADLYGDITGNTAGWGAAIRNDASGIVTIYAGNYSNNTTTVNGGAIYNNGGIVNILGGNFTGNTSTSDGGAIYNKGTIDIKGGTFTGNSCSANTGGVIRNEASGTVKISAGTFSGNTANKGGVIYNFGTLEITGGTFKSNTGTTSGGVLHAQWGSTKYTVTIANASFYNNSSKDGGALLCTDATITNCIFGGYDENGDSLGNSASDRGGVICQWSAGTINVSNCTFINNTGGQGNALYSSAGTITVSNSRINASDAVKTAEDYIIINALPEAKIGEQSYDTLEEAVEVANADTSGEPVEITVLNHVQLEKELTIKGNIIFNTSDSNPVVISGASSSTGDVVLIRINSGKTLNIAGAITVDGNDIARPALIQNDGGTFKLGADAVVVNAKRESGWGAAFFNNANGTAHLSGDFRGNTAQVGAAVRNSGTAYICGGTYQSNTASNRGGAIMNQGTLEITGGTFQANTSTNTALGGGVINNQGTLKISAGTFQNNSANYRGGAIYNDAAGTLEITGGTFRANSTVDAGGAIWCASTSTSVSIKNANFYSNSAIDSNGNGNGGAILCYTATIENCVFDGNTASTRAGAVCQWSGTITITGCSFANNIGATGKILYGNGTITVTNSTGITSNDVHGANITIVTETSLLSSVLMRMKNWIL